MKPLSLITRICILFTLLSLPTKAEQLLVVVNEDSTVEQLSRQQVIDLFMGKYNAFPNGERATVYELNKHKDLRESFYSQLIDKPIGFVNAYWSRVKFSGRAVPPQKKTSEADLIEAIQRDNNAIAYIYKSSFTKGLKVVYDFSE